MSLLSRLAVQAARAYGILSSADKTKVAASYLVVAGGGSGYNGGGGAGGYQTSTFTLSTLNTYSITIGAGGSAWGLNNGSNSSISGTGLTTVTSVGGGSGGSTNGQSGGSGGGANWNGTGGAGTSGQGNNGGNGGGTTYPNEGAGGGGGAGAVGSNGTSAGVGGAGGNGSSSSISGSSTTYAGGGGGWGRNSSGAGGSGGGANGGGGTGGNATANTGGGGGGSDGTGGSKGGSGIVIISYASATPKFVGGTLTTSGGNQIHTFTSSGTLSPLTPVTASYLVVAGGGGGALGGGGAGGYQTSSTTLYSGGTYVVTIGAGGTAGTVTSTNGGQGNNSVLSGIGLTTITSTGGGYAGSSGGQNGGNGGSGGGGGSGNSGGTGTSGQGNNGGAGIAGNASPYSGGGGGGASVAGGNGSGSAGGSGGNGTSSSISGSSVTYAGGGGGGVYLGGYLGGTAGTGGGGAGASGAAGTSGTANTGGGGGGAGNTFNGGTGGSGTVIISYAGSQVFNGGLVTSSGGNTIHTFNATGALTPLTNNLNNSLRFRSSASAYLNRTPTVAGNSKTWTWSAWVKLGALGTTRGLFGAQTTAGVDTDRFFVRLNSSDKLFIYEDISNTGTTYRITTQVFRDPSAWYHIVVAFDTTQATADNRIKLYVNGQQITAFDTNNAITLNRNTFVNAAIPQSIGADRAGTLLPFDGYMTDINLVDGQQLEPYYFGNNDANGVWKPIKYTGMYGTNGFYLTFGNTTSTTTLGYDSSPNGNNWTTNNISLTAGTTYDAMTDVPTNTSATVANYCVLSPLNYRTYSGSATPTISNANLTVTQSSTVASCIGTATMGVTASGKYYWEATFVSGSGSNNSFLGVVAGQLQNTTAADLGYYSNEYAYKSGNGYKYSNNTSAAYGSSYTSGDVIGFALDLDAGTLTFYKNNTSQGVAYSSLSASETYFPAFDTYYNNTFAYNFGQRAFAYTPPTGHIAINTYNLPTPTILQGNKYMDATLYTGTGASLVTVNAGQFKPDFVWLKSRSNAYNHELYDSVRGVQKRMNSNATNAESTSTNGLTAFNSNGFTQGGEYETGLSGNYVGWQWQAGQGSTSSNTSGSITSTVSVNTTAGFSVVTYTGTGANATVGHGLGVAPKMIIVKNRSNGGAGDGAWQVYHTSIGAANYLVLNTTAASAAGSTRWQSTTPTLSVFYIGNTGSVNNTSENYVAYCWAEIAGFSKFGSYTGNGSADGPFVYTGFRPKYIMFKNSSAISDWHIEDTSRDTYNVANKYLLAQDAGAEGTYTCCDILSNGFKLRNGSSSFNPSSQTVIFMAFAENPFKNANAR